MTHYSLRAIAVPTLLLIAGLGASTAHAASGDLLIKAKGSYNLRAGNETVDFTLDGTPVSAKPTHAVGIEASIAMFLTDTLAVEGTLGGGKLDLQTPAGRGVISSGTIIPALTLQFYPAGSEAKIRPYLGVGAAYFKFYSAKPEEVFTNRPTTPAMPQLNDRIEFDSKIVPVAQAGLDYAITPSAFLTLEARYAAANTKVHISTTTLTTTDSLKVQNISVSLGAGFRF